MNKLQTKKGFTIIEVVLVLAIAGLIFLMVFLALPALQRSQRDTQRKNDLSRIQAAVASYQANNKGEIPSNHIHPTATLGFFPQGNEGEAGYVEPTAFVKDYLFKNGDKMMDPSGRNYRMLHRDPGYPLVYYPHSDYVDIEWIEGAICDESDPTGVRGGQGNRKVAMRVPLEGGGVYCLNN